MVVWLMPDDDSQKAAKTPTATPAAATPIPAPEVQLTNEEKQLWAKLPPDRSAIPVLLYHGIGPESNFANAADDSYGVAADDFAKQMTEMKHAGYQTVGLRTFLDFVDKKPVDLPPRPLLLTFDDARADSWTGGDAILEKLGFKAVMFVDVGRVDGGETRVPDLEGARDHSGQWPVAAAASLRSGSHVDPLRPRRRATGRSTPTRNRARTSTAGRSACAPTSTGARHARRPHPCLQAARLRAAVRQLRPGRHQRPEDPATISSAG